MAGLLGAVALTAGCDLSKMAFVQDKRLTIVAPAEDESVTLPLTIQWEITDFEITGKDGSSRTDAGYFAVFIDRSAIQPGTTLEELAAQPNSCGDSICGSVDKLPDIYVTKKTSLTLEQLPGYHESGEPRKHEVIIVLMDGTGKRIGESAFYVDFEYELSEL